MLPFFSIMYPIVASSLFLIVLTLSDISLIDFGFVVDLVLTCDLCSVECCRDQYVCVRVGGSCLGGQRISLYMYSMWLITRTIFPSTYLKPIELMVVFGLLAGLLSRPRSSCSLLLLLQPTSSPCLGV